MQEVRGDALMAQSLAGAGVVAYRWPRVVVVDEGSLAEN